MLNGPELPIIVLFMSLTAIFVLRGPLGRAIGERIGARHGTGDRELQDLKGEVEDLRHQLDEVQERLNELARRALKPEDLQPPLRLDAQVGLKDMHLARLDELERLRPTGQGNPSVQFFAGNLTHHRPLQRIGADRQHVKMWVTDGTLPQESVWWDATCLNPTCE